MIFFVDDGGGGGGVADVRCGLFPQMNFYVSNIPC